MNTHNTHNVPTNDDEISLKELIRKFQDWWRYLLSKWLFILIVGLLGGALGLIYSISKKPSYVATLTFVLEEEGAGGPGNLGGLAAMAGFNVGRGVFQGDNIFELYKSRSILSKTLLSHSAQNDSLLIERYLAFNKIRENWKENSKTKAIDFSIPLEKFTFEHDSIIGKIVEAIRSSYLDVSKPNKKTSLIHVETTSINENFSKDFTIVLVENVSRLYINTRIKKNIENLSILQRQTDSVRRELNAAISGVASSVDANPNANPARQVLRASSSKRQVDVQTNQVILTELVKNLEMAKISLRREAPLIQIIDEPILPLKKERIGKLKGIALGGVLAGFLVVLFFISKRGYNKIMNQ